MARHAGCSRRLLDLRFAQFHSESVRDALVRTRLEAVRRELAAGDRKFGQVAAECGFASAAALNNLFRKTYGLSLREFRKRRNTPANQ